MPKYEEIDYTKFIGVFYPVRENEEEIQAELAERRRLKQEEEQRKLEYFMAYRENKKIKYVPKSKRKETSEDNQSP